MAAVLVLFDRAKRLAADMKPTELQRKARLNAKLAKCRHPEILAVDAEAAELLKAGEPNHVVLERCESLARELVRQRTERCAS